MFIINKIFNLKIDTKNKNITTVTGLKQFDNNSILNITLLQNSLALDLSNCTVRINFLREDERVLLYIANIDNAKEGKVSIKLSPEVLEKSGLVKADISVFDSNLLKITSTTFNLKVDKAIYDDTYFTDKDLDLMQQEYVREKERQNNENNRKSNESNRVQAETKRGQNENTRISNEEARKKAENTRVSEWNNVKKDANNIKNTLDTTIDTANKSNSNLKNTINAGDKLKQELNVNNYVTNAKYSEFEKKTNSQYEDIEKQLKNSSTKTITKNSNILNLENNVQGIANITVEGNTIDVNKEPIVSDFKDKVLGSVLENPNICTSHWEKELISKPTMAKENEHENVYSKIKTLDNNCGDASEKREGYIPQQVFSFNLISIIEREKGTIPGSSTKEKVEWLKKSINKLTCQWYGYGKCVNGNVAYIANYKTTKGWVNPVKMVYKTPCLGVFSLVSNNVVKDSRIDESGFAHFIVYTDGSDGKTVSNIYTDYVNIEIKLKTEYKSVGEKEKQIEIKSVADNLFNGELESGRYTIANGLPFDDPVTVRTSKKIRVKPDTTYSIKLFSDSNIYNISEYNNNAFLNTIRNFKSSLTFTTTKDTNCINISLNTPNLNSKVALVECDKIPEYKPYKEDKIVIQLKEPLCSFRNIVKDTLNSDGTVVRRIKQTVLNGTEKWVENKEWSKDSLIAFYCKLEDCLEKPNDTVNIVNDTFDSYSVDRISQRPLSGMCLSPAKLLSIIIPKNTLQTQDVEGLRKYLKENPVTIFYELAKPIVETVGQSLILKTFKDGQIVVDTDIAPYTIVDYPTNVSSRVSTLENAEKNLKDSLGGAWKSLLILADKDLKMKSISPLKTTTTEDLKNKINEIIGVW